MQMSSLPSSGKRKKGASRVFGEAVFNEIDASLCYTPSPGPSSTKSAMGPRSFIRGIREECEPEPPEPMFLFQSSEQLRTETSHTFEKCLSFGTEKENCNGIGSDATVQANSSTNLIRKNELIRLRANNKSPIRSALVKTTEAAIDDATNSIAKSMGTRKSDFKIHESLNVTREPKSGILRVKSKTAKSVRFQRDQEISQSKTLRDKVEESRRDIRAIQRQLSSAHFKEKAKKDEAIKMQRFACLEKEYTFNSEIFRDHQQTLKQERDKSRKMSTETRAKIRRNNRAGEEKLKILRRGEEEAMLEVRADLHKARMEATRANSETRRLSFQFRAGDARKIRVMRLKWKEIQLEKEHESYELTRAASKDVERHKKLVEKEKRDDAKSRNLEARRRRKLDEEQAGEAMLAEHKSYELKWAGEQDAKAYQIIMRDERRKSLAGRNKESARHAKVMEELRGLAKEKEAESYILKWAGENDAKAYLAKLADDRRKSLQFRATEAREQRSHEEEEHATAVQKAREEGILQSACKFERQKQLLLFQTRLSAFLIFPTSEFHLRSTGC